jgi:tRNA A58 N-methylase Trm61
MYYQLTKKEIFVPFIPADPRGLAAMCKAVNLQGTENVVDIGSGWGTIIFYLADIFPKLQLTGIELNPILHFIAEGKRRFLYRSHQIALFRGDAATFTYCDYDIIFLFMLSPFVNTVLVPKFEKELKIGTRIVSYVFRMKSVYFKEKQLLLPAHGWRSAVYIYEKIK